jgi:hypothetical protein
MSRYSTTDATSQAGDWLAGAARRNPEALLLLAAGCCLLMRSRGSSSSRLPSRNRYGELEQSQSGSNRVSSDAGRVTSNLGGLSGAAESASDYASDIGKRVSDTAGAYAESISEFAQDAYRNVSERSARLGRQAQSTLQDNAKRVLRDQPLAVAVVGLAAGAAVAALFPSTKMEGRTLGGAREALTDAAGKAGEMVLDAAGKAKERLQAAAEERGFSSEGVQGLASEVAEAFTGAVTGKSGDRDSPPLIPKASASGTTTGQGSSSAGTSPGAGSIGAGGLGAGQGNRDTNRDPDMAHATKELGRGR